MVSADPESVKMIVRMDVEEADGQLSGRKMVKYAAGKMRNKRKDGYTITDTLSVAPNPMKVGRLFRICPNEPEGF